MLKDEIFADIGIIEKDEKLYREKSFSLRQQAIDDIDFHIIDRIDAQITDAAVADNLKQYANQVKQLLEDVDERMFDELRAKISTGGYKGKLLADMIAGYFDDDLNCFTGQDAVGYNDLDVFLNRLLTDENAPVETKDREPEMVFYQKTPARVIFELIKRADFKPGDVFFDIGCGLGQVNILVNLLTDVTSKGIEFEPAFCSYAKVCAANLNLTDVDFINIDARYADYSSGTVFFMYTPFGGKMLKDVLEILKAETEKRVIKIYAYGPCTIEVAQQNWLVNKTSNRLNGFGEFFSSNTI